MAADDTPAKSTPASTSSSDAPTNYSRGENQKSVTQTYRDNWNAIFGKPERQKPARKTAAPRKTAAKKKGGVKKTAAKTTATKKAKRKSRR